MQDDKEKSHQQPGQQQSHQGNPPGQNQPQPGQQHQGQPGQKQDDKRPSHGQEEDDKFNKERRAS